MTPMSEEAPTATEPEKLLFAGFGSAVAELTFPFSVHTPVTGGAVEVTVIVEVVAAAIEGFVHCALAGGLMTQVKPPPPAVSIVPPPANARFTTTLEAASGPLLTIPTVHVSLPPAATGVVAVAVPVRSAAATTAVDAVWLLFPGFESAGVDETRLAVLVMVPGAPALRTTVTDSGVPIATAGKVQLIGGAVQLPEEGVAEMNVAP